MKHIRDASVEEVQAAYMARDGWKYPGDEFEPNDPRHPRWCHPVDPGDGSEPMLDALRAIGVEPEQAPGAVVQITGNDSRLIFVRINGTGVWLPRWPDKEGLYGIGSAPQYAIRRDYGRHTLAEVIERLKGLAK